MRSERVKKPLHMAAAFVSKKWHALHASAFVV